MLVPASFVTGTVSLLLRGCCGAVLSSFTDLPSGPSTEVSNSLVGLPPNIESYIQYQEYMLTVNVLLTVHVHVLLNISMLNIEV